MGTRNLIAVYYKGKYHIAVYCQYDGYPSGQGRDMLEFARDPQLMANLQAALDAGMVYEATAEEIEEIYERAAAVGAALDAKSKDTPSWPLTMSLPTGMQPLDMVCPSLSITTGAKILRLVADTTERVPVRNELAFIANSSFCEWAWVLDLDERTLECWTGGGGSRKVITRFHEHVDDIKSGYARPPTVQASFSLDKLPDEPTFLRECGEILED